MAFQPFASVLRRLRLAVSARDGGELTDGELLRSFVDRGDQGAFETLVHRHGAAVLGTCRRILGHQQDAEDAFQATFLVLARKAASIAVQETVGNWLYGVAYRTALKVKVTNARRRNRESQAAAMLQQRQQPNEAAPDLQPLLDQELHRLPAKYRAPIVLCDLEGKTRPEAARQLGWPEGTLSWRLASGRSMLAKRLQRHGVTLSAAALGLALAENASARAPAHLIASTVKAAGCSSLSQAAAAGLISTDVAALTEGVLRTMFYAKLTLAGAVCLTLALMATGVVVASYAAADRAKPADRDLKDAQGLVAAAEGRDREPQKVGDVVGKITAISGDGKVLTVQTGGGGRGEAPTTAEAKLTAKTKIEFTGVGKDLNRKLKVGDWVSITLEDGSAGSIQATAAPDLSGKITAVAADGKTLTIETPPTGRERGAKTFDVKVNDKTQTVKMTSRGGEDVQADKPEVGLSASVWLVEGSKDVAAALFVRKPSPPGKPGDRR